MCTCGHAQAEHRYNEYECTITTQAAAFDQDGKLVTPHQHCPCVAYQAAPSTASEPAPDHLTQAP